MHKMRYVRFAVGAAVLLVIFAAMQWHGVAVGSLCMLCPVGFAQVWAASGNVPWGLVPAVLLLLVAAVLVGRAFCAWLCPTGLLKNIFGGHAPRGVAGKVGGCAACAQGGRSNVLSQGAVLAVLLAVSFAVGFPVFCLLCPIGLALGTLYAVSRMFVLWQPGWELVVFPLILLAEVFLFKRWCAAICPLGFFFGVAAKLRTKLGFAFGPRVAGDTCRSTEGCGACGVSCPEDINVPAATMRDLEDCTLCLECTHACPTKSVKIGMVKKGQ